MLLMHGLSYGPALTRNTKERACVCQSDQVGLRPFSVLVANPKKTTLHGGQSRSWSAEKAKANKRKSLAAYPLPPTPHTARSENVIPWYMSYPGVCYTVYVIPWYMSYPGVCYTLVYVIPWCMSYPGTRYILCPGMLYVWVSHGTNSSVL